MKPPTSIIRVRTCLALGLGAALTACGGGGSDGGTSDLSAGMAKVSLPDGTQVIVDSSASSGQVDSLQLLGMHWGRRVDIVQERDSEGALMMRHRNLVVDPNILDGVPYRLALNPVFDGACIADAQYMAPPVLEQVTNPNELDAMAWHVLLSTDPITQETTMVIGPDPTKIPANDTLTECPTFEGADPRYSFDLVITALLNGVEQMRAKSDLPTTLGPFDKIARNASLVLRFNDVLDPETITAGNIQVRSGEPPTIPFQAAVRPDPNFGRVLNLDGSGVVSEGNFRPSRVIVDMSVTTIDPGSGLTTSTVGLPPSTLQNAANVSIRIPTEVDFSVGQFTLLANLGGAALDPLNNADRDTSITTTPIVRGFRSGRATDIDNGFLPDNTPPVLISQIPVVATNIANEGETYTFIAAFEDFVGDCKAHPRAGDLFQFPGFRAQVTEDALENEDGTYLTRVRIPAGTPTSSSSTGVFALAYEGASPRIPVTCFLSIGPEPGTFPNVDVSSTAQIAVTFSEAMDPDTVNPLEDFLITQKAITYTPPNPPPADPLNPPPGYDPGGALEEWPEAFDFGPKEIVVAGVENTDDLRSFLLRPTLPLANDGSLNYHVVLGEFAQGLSDLAGNRVTGMPFDKPLPIAFTVAAPGVSDPVYKSRGFVLRFDELNEDDDGGPEVHGQFTNDLAAGVLAPRPVQRYSGIIDRNNAPQTLMTDLVQAPGALQPPQWAALGDTVYDLGLSEPLNPFGCRMMSIWRHCDIALSTGETPSQVINPRHDELYNLDVEGLAWAAPFGTVQADVFPEFGIWLGHGNRFPDQYTQQIILPIPPVTPAPLTTTGMITSSFSNNVLNDPTRPEGPLVNVHPKSRGYVVDPATSFTTPTGALMMPYPLNESPDPSTHRFYTWRDTAIRTEGGDPGMYIQWNSDDINNGVMDIPFGVVPDEIFRAGNPLNYAFRGQVAVQGALPSIVLPLLVDFRCYPSNLASGLNQLDWSYAGYPTIYTLATPPDFRVYSAGGTNIQGEVVNVNPDLAQVPSGGFNQNPLAGNGIGSATPSGDSVSYMGQVDFVVRVSRAHSIWVGTTVGATFVDPEIFPRNNQQPQGTNISIDMRGADLVPIVIETMQPLVSAGHLDAYGDVPFADVGGTNLLEPHNTGTAGPGVPGGGGPSGGKVFDDSPYAPYEDESFLFPQDDKQTYAPAIQRNANIEWVADGPEWTDRAADLNGAKFFQFRISFQNNPASGARPVLDSIGFAYTLP